MAITIDGKNYDETKLDDKCKNSVVQVQNLQARLRNLQAEFDNIKVLITYHSKYLTDNLPTSDPSKMDFGSQGMEKKKAWKDIWGCGQGISVIKEVVSTSDLVKRLKNEYTIGKKLLSGEAA